MRDASEPRPPESEWFDLWHSHPASGDSGAPGSDAWRKRLRSLFAAWGRVEIAAGRLARPWQSWLVIDPAEPGQDAVYLHTPNPNRDNFPYRFEGVTWGAEPPAGLAELWLAQGRSLGGASTAAPFYTGSAGQPARPNAAIQRTPPAAVR